LTILIISGCASQIVLYPLGKENFIYIPKGSQLGNYTTETEGFYLSKLYLEKVMQARIKSK